LITVVTAGTAKAVGESGKVAQLIKKIDRVLPDEAPPVVSRPPVPSPRPVPPSPPSGRLPPTPKPMKPAGPINEVDDFWKNDWIQDPGYGRGTGPLPPSAPGPGIRPPYRPPGWYPPVPPGTGKG
jgi:hypothetical protein